MVPQEHTGQMLSGHKLAGSSDAVKDHLALLQETALSIPMSMP